MRIGAGTVLTSHVVVSGRTTIGRSNRFFPFCSIGGVPQDKKYGGEDTELVIGDGNTIRESCTISIGTAQGGGVTRIGSDNWIMAYVHIAHDCSIGDHTILANNATLAGHVTLGDWVIMGGMSAIHQFCAMGPHSMAAGGSIVLRDVPPFVICSGNPAEPHGINTEGLKRRGFDAETINALRRAYRTLYKDGLTTAEAVKALAAFDRRGGGGRSLDAVPGVRAELAARHHSLMPPATCAFVAGEASGDLLAAGVIGELRSRDPALRCVGVGGDRMIAAGFDAWAHVRELSVRGYVEVLRHLPRLLALRRALKRRLLALPPAVFVGVDAPDFNLGLEEQLRAQRHPRRALRQSVDLGLARRAHRPDPPRSGSHAAGLSVRAAHLRRGRHSLPPTSAIRWPA